ncbi:potassium channel family protein [Nanoarchaeota archaeon]
MVSKKKGVKNRPKARKKSPLKKVEEEVLSHIPSAETIKKNIEEDSKDVSLLKLINYVLLFFIPTMILGLFALKIGSVYSDYFEASAQIISKILMLPFMVLVFFFIIPYISDREKIAGIRYSVLAFLIIGIGLSLPSALDGRYGLIMMIPTYFAAYILLTFFFCPEVLGIERNLRDWFKHKKQFSIVAIYISIVLLFVVGFGGLYYEIYLDSPEAFELAVDKEVHLESFIYYSMVSFTSTGYGEMLPVSTAARLLFFMEGLVALIMNVLFIAILLVFISNAEFLSQRKEEKEIHEEFKKEEAELRKEEKEIRRVEKEVKHVEKEEEGFMKKFYKKMKPW